MRSLEEIRAMLYEGDESVVYHRNEYKGIKVDIGSDNSVSIKTAESTTWLKSDTEDVEAQVNAIPANGSFMEIPKSVWEKWLAEPFHW